MESLSNRIIGYRHSHPWIQVSYAVRGVLEVATEKGRFIALPHRAIWIPAGIAHQVHVSGDTLIRSLYVDPKATARSSDACFVLEVSDLLRELIRAFSEMPENYAQDGPEGRLAAVLLDQLAAAPATTLALPWPAEPRILAICQALQAQPAAHDSLDDWARRLSVSRKTLSRSFLQETGLGYRQWRQRLRLMHSLPLLEQGRSVTDVAFDCGYGSVSAYIAAFKTQLGHTPGEFFPTAQAAGKRTP
ncbi:helix-turn-helix transcriptional regulator [Pusillimonas sp.]|uniref:AraC family transcriptional regulator n=1 Tax=Pusillimonas sp. TaxID=3040095 RepID=UPI0029BC0F18|nr:helix-turn-helix transcriptional regulator [Pusillimonas sp.]MDX3893198.1 helix-turn-helix transcriptional regulator [Pusillimonas sp.]